MRPLRVTAHLSTPPLFAHRSGPLLLDALLLFALGVRMGAAHPSGIVPAEDVIDAADAGGVPLGRVEGPDGMWWYACSAIAPQGPEAITHRHRRPALDLIEQHTAVRSVNVGAGPDKALRIPNYTRPAMLVLTWTCWGDAAAIRDMLQDVPSVGKDGGSGRGHVRRWVVEDDPDGPPMSAYASDLALRPVPVAAIPVPDMARYRSLRRHRMPLRSPYYRLDRAVPCWLIPEAA